MLTSAALGQDSKPAEIEVHSADDGTIISEVVSEPFDTAAEEERTKAFLKLVQERGVFGAYLLDLNNQERALSCGYIVDYLASGAGAASDPAERLNRIPEVWRLDQRAAPIRQAALEQLSKDEVSTIRRKTGEALTMQSMVPDPEMQKNYEFNEGNFAFQFASVLAFRCHQSFDENGVPDVDTEPTAGFIERNTRFQFRGMDYEKAFAGTGLEPFAKGICQAQTLFDFNGAPIKARGEEGMSLLDWAVECEDRPAFEALIKAGFDVDAPGLWENPPVVNSATAKRLWFLRKMLDAGASPDAMGRNETALTKAMTDFDAINYGGDASAAFNLLRERGASLNFPTYRESTWLQWGLHGRQDGWATILSHWDEFESDPVGLAGLAESVLDGDLEWLADQKGDAAKVKALLIKEHGVCFPVGNTYDMATDERGFRIQPDCPTKL